MFWGVYDRSIDLFYFFRGIFLRFNKENFSLGSCWGWFFSWNISLDRSENFLE